MTGGPDLLATIVAATRRIIEVRRAREPLEALAARAERRTPRGGEFEAALRGRGGGSPGFVGAARQTRPEEIADGTTGIDRRARPRVIAECKRRSPSRGVLAVDYDPAAIARRYEAGGAAAISVLTEPTFFDGSLEHLAAVRSAVERPLLRKDFVVDEYQLFEARAAGADAVLLIVSALAERELARLQQRAWELGLAALVEVHDEAELARAIDSGARIVGVNNRNLRTLDIDVEASYRLAAQMPKNVVAVSESGLQSRSDLERLTAAGYHAFLIGERFMTDADPARALQALIGGRESFSEDSAAGSVRKGTVL
ncbi:MAG TPA: indole-3-glycerol phosphate synthase TrpC [Vicinamibacterales bacterium]|nr:indole-3-glycerol phosphate synthase TrpC [Vicinamibacterales bacterium]